MEPMRDLEHEAREQKAQEQNEAVISGWTLSRYFQLVRIPVLAAVIAEMVLYILIGLNAVVWLFHIALFLYLVGTVKDLTAQRAVALGAVAGFLAGLGMAIFRLVYERAAYFILNLIAEPVITALLGALITAVAVQLIKQRKEKRIAKQQSQQSSKGGK
ncbi:MAG: hypothetical protein WCV86_00850 [Patescibacteria group bacterium]|jgi:hypothetical protein